MREGDDDLRSLVLTDRRKRLEALFKKHKAPPSDLVRLTPQSVGDGNALMKQAREENWEGLMVKLARSPYRTAKRSPEWIKHKLNKQDEFVVVGWTDPGGTRDAFRIADPRRARHDRPSLCRRSRHRLQGDRSSNAS